MQLYRCKKCNYTYDPKLGDAIGGISPQTPFEDIPEDWICPICGAKKEMFVKT